MKTSELIKRLQGTLNKHGDLDVLMDHPIDYAPVTINLLAIHDLYKREKKPLYLSFEADDMAFPCRESESYSKVIVVADQNER